MLKYATMPIMRIMLTQKRAEMLAVLAEMWEHPASEVADFLIALGFEYLTKAPALKAKIQRRRSANLCQVGRPYDQEC